MSSSCSCLLWMYTYLVEKRGSVSSDVRVALGCSMADRIALSPLRGSPCDRVSGRFGKAHGARFVSFRLHLQRSAVYVQPMSPQRGLCVAGLCLAASAPSWRQNRASGPMQQPLPGAT